IPPEQFDEKGHIKKHNGEELAALKGKDKHLPGYESSIETLKPGQIVQVKLSLHKKPRSASASSRPVKYDWNEAEKEKPAASDQNKNGTIEHKNQVGLIVILEDNNSEPAPTNPAKNKNNK